MPENLKPLTVLFVDHGEGLGGAEYSLLQLLRRLDRSRFRPLLACDEGALAAAARAAAIETKTTPLPPMRGRAAGFVKLWRSGQRLAAMIEQEDVWLVHSNTMRASFVAALAARLTRRPLVWHARDLYGPGEIGGRWYPWLMSRLAQVVIANSNAVARTIPRPDVQVIYNGVELDRFEPDREPSVARAVLGLPDAEVLIGTVGRLQPWKQHHLFIEAACQIIAQIPQARFVIVGGRVFQADAAYQDQLRAQAARAGLVDRLDFAGQQSDIAAWLAAMDIFVHCSRAEPFGRVVVEAMAAGRPVVAFSDGGVPEIVVDGQTGRLVTPSDVEALAEAIIDLVRKRDLARQMGQAGRARTAALFSAESHVRQVENVYLRLYEPSRTHAAPSDLTR